MTATKVMDIKSRLPGCSGQAADAVSAYTQVKMEDAPTLLKKIQSQNAQIFGSVYHDTNGQNHGPVWKIQWFFLKGICTVILWQGCHGKGNLRKSNWNMAWRRFPIGNAYSYTVKNGYSYLCMWTILKLAGKTEHRIGLKNSHGRRWLLPTSFLDHENLGCTQTECQISKDIVTSYRDMFESRISAGAEEKLPTRASGKPDAETISSWSYDMESHAKKCVERYCELANKTTQQLYKVSTPCIHDHHFKEEETKSVGEWSHVCSKIVLKCLYLARIGRLDILRSVNKLARSITKWTKACDRRLNRLIS